MSAAWRTPPMAVFDGGGADQHAGEGVVEFAQGHRLHAVRVAMRSSTSLRRRSVKCLRISPAWSNFRYTRMVAMIWGVRSDEVGGGGRVHPLEASMPAVSEPCSTRPIRFVVVVAEGLGEHGLDVSWSASMGVPLSVLVAISSSSRTSSTFSALWAGMRPWRRALDLLRAEQFEDFGGSVGAQGHQEQGALFEAFIVAAHCFPSIPDQVGEHLRVVLASSSAFGEFFLVGQAGGGFGERATSVVLPSPSSPDGTSRLGPRAAASGGGVFFLAGWGRPA